MRVQFTKIFEDVIGVDNLLSAWKEFLRGKRSRNDVEEFEFQLIHNILALHRDLANGSYRHGGYQAFNISDPKPRSIHKASVRDRLLHHATYRQFYPFFDRTFIADSFSCRIGKGTHAALNRFKQFYLIVSKNDTRQCWVLKCDIKKFFANIDHKIFIKIISEYISDEKLLLLVKEIIDSFSSARSGVGLPLGNLTSQLFINIYMNEFDQFMKHHLRAKYYIRYADDFVIFSPNCEWLEVVLPEIASFLRDCLGLELHPKKVSIRTVSSGIDFLGWVHFPDHRVLRTTTRRRMGKRISETEKSETLTSYRGLLSHGNARKLQEKYLRKYI
jgi:RNA-directed DNA polymerase